MSSASRICSTLASKAAWILVTTWVGCSAASPNPDAKLGVGGFEGTNRGSLGISGGASGQITAIAGVGGTTSATTSGTAAQGVNTAGGPGGTATAGIGGLTGVAGTTGLSG